jgi:NADH:ubiquinone reductase (H+-translocating)
MASPPHVVVLGGGFAGLGALKRLEKAPVRVTLIDQNNYHTFQPLLYQVATAELSPDAVGVPVRPLLKDRADWRFHRARVTGIDPAARTVAAEGMGPIPYDYLVVALGATANFFGTPGAADHAFPLYAMRDALKLRAHILERFEAVAKDPALVDAGALRFCVVGGGATGVETAGALAELIRENLATPGLSIDRAEVHLYHRGPALLGPFTPKLRAYARKALEARGVRVHLGESVEAVAPTAVRLRSGAEVQAHTVVWGTGIQANSLAGALGAELEQGRVVVRPDLSLTGHPEVFVVGDLALITDATTGERLPQLGSVAQQAGFRAGENIGRLVAGKRTEPFAYKDKGTMATVGHGAAVVQFRSGRTLTGRAAWLAWLGVHLMLLSGGSERSHAVADWGWQLLTHKRGQRIVVE